MLSKIEVASGKYTVVFLPRNKKIPRQTADGKMHAPQQHAREARSHHDYAKHHQHFAEFSHRPRSTLADASRTVLSRVPEAAPLQ